MSKETSQRNGPTQSERAYRRTTNDMLAKSGQLYDELCAAADEVIEEYKQRNRAIGRARKEKRQFAPIPWPERRETSRGRHSIYWKILRPNGSRGKFRVASDQIKRAKGPEPYPAKVLLKETDEMNRELVLATEQRLRAIERLMKAAREVQETMRKASKESERE